MNEPSLQPSRKVHWAGIGAILLIVLLAVGSAAAFMRRESSQSITGPLLTHSIQRDDLIVTVTEQGTLESQDNIEIKCKVRGENTVIWVIENGAMVEEGDVLVRLDTLTIEDQINERSKYALWSLSGAEQSRANAKRAALAIKEYEEGQFVTELKTMQKDLAIAEANLLTAKNMLQHTQMMFERRYVSELEVEEKDFRVTQAKLSVDVKKTEIEALVNFTKKQRLDQLTGDLKAAEANRDSLNERAKMDGTRRDLALAELEHCVIKAPKRGMVIYPSAQAWESTPDIEEGATVYRDQTLLLMPDMENMQVKVGIHESIVDRIQTGLQAKITLPDSTLEGSVDSVASVAQPAGWWTGNMVKYDTIVALPVTSSGLRPGMSAEVEIVLAEHSDVLTIPVAAVIETSTETLCWVQTGSGVERRAIQLGDSNDVFIVVEEGVLEGDAVVLNPSGSIEEARAEALKVSTIAPQPNAASSATKDRVEEPDRPGAVDAKQRDDGL